MKPLEESVVTRAKVYVPTLELLVVSIEIIEVGFCVIQLGKVPPLVRVT